MKLVIGGATGFVGSDLLRQALLSKEISSIIAVGRRPASAPEGTDASKLDNIVSKDLTQYSDEAKQKLAGVDACIWYVSCAGDGQDMRVCYNHPSKLMMLQDDCGNAEQTEGHAVGGNQESLVRLRYGRTPDVG